MIFPILKTCAFCGDTFDTADARQTYCRTACSNRGTAAVRRQSAAARIRARLEQRVGPLSDREFEVARAADAIGYQRGYHQARHENHRDEEAA